MPRWSGPGRRTTPGHYWRTISCEYCGLKYRDFRITDELPWMDNPWELAMQELVSEREPPGTDEVPDPSRPVNRWAVLGRMFQYKQEGWKKHLDTCEEWFRMCTYINNHTGEQATLIKEEELSGRKFYTLQYLDGETARWSDVHFKRSWSKLEDSEKESGRL